MVFENLQDYIKANGLIKTLPAEKIAEDLIETGNFNYKNAFYFLGELLNYRRDPEVFEAATKVVTTEGMFKGKKNLFEDCAHKIINNAIVFDDMTCIPFFDKDMMKEFEWSAESAVEEEWCIGALNVLIDNGYDAKDLFDRKFKDDYTREGRLAEIGSMCKRHTCENIVDKKNKLDELGDKFKGEVLSTLTRGELQTFLDDSRLFGCHSAIINLEAEQLFNVSDEEVEDYLSDPKYGSYLQDLRKSFDYLTKNKILKIRDDYSEEELNELIYEDLETTNYRIKNMVEILKEPNLAQRNKWLREIKRIPLSDDEKILALRGEYSTPNLKINRILTDIETETRREFYTSIGIDYDNYGVNKAVPSPVRYGIEIEEDGVEYFYNTAGFQGHSDYSIQRYSKRTHEFDTKVSGEYVSEIFKTDSLKNLSQLRKQSDVLNLLGATTNTSCGFHVHCSDEHILMTLQEKSKLYNYGEYKDYIENAKENGDSLFYYGINKEFQDMQRIIAKKLNVFSERTEGYSEFLDEEDNVPDMERRERFVNFRSLDKHGSIEFRFLNLPDSVDPKVMEAYIDFCTCYYSYLTEENFTNDYAKEAYEEVTGNSIDELSQDEYEDLKFNILMDQLLVKDDTKKVIDHLDEIFEFYNVQNENGIDFDFFTGYDKTIKEDNENKEIYNLISSIASTEVETEETDMLEDDEIELI